MEREGRGLHVHGPLRLRAASGVVAGDEPQRDATGGEAGGYAFAMAEASVSGVPGQGGAVKVAVGVVGCGAG